MIHMAKSWGKNAKVLFFFLSLFSYRSIGALCFDYGKAPVIFTHCKTHYNKNITMRAFSHILSKIYVLAVLIHTLL